MNFLAFTVEVYSSCYRHRPYRDADAAKRLLALGVRVIGLDALSPDDVAPKHKGIDVKWRNGGHHRERLARLDALADSNWKHMTMSWLQIGRAHV